MSLILGKSDDQYVKTYAWDSDVCLWVKPNENGKALINMEDFLEAAYYVLTNTDLTPNDPRPEFLERVKRLAQGKGFNPGQQRLR